jgi:hypothetical protein
MPSYPVYVVVDPSNAEAGTKVVESGLARVTAKAAGVQAAVQRAFDFNATPAQSAATAVDKALEGVTSTAAAAATAVNRVGDSFKVLAAPSAAAATNLRQVNDNLVKLYGSTEQASKANGRFVNSQQQVRQGNIILGEQFRQFSTQVLSGGSVVQAFAQQSGQAAFALQFFNGKLGAVGQFLSGPWGTVLIIGATLLASFVGELLKQNNALDEAIDKLKKDAKETETNRLAKEAFNRTLEGQIALQRELNKELDKSILTQRQQQQITLLQTQTNLTNLKGDRPKLVERISQAQKDVESATTAARYAASAGAIGGGGQAGQAGIVQAIAKLEALKKSLVELDEQVTRGERTVREAQVPLIKEDVESALDKKKAAADRYTIALGRLNLQLAIGANNSKNVKLYNSDGSFSTGSLSGVNRDQYATQLARITKERDEAIKAAEKAERLANAGDGVERFRTREQAVGVAGKELQRSGLRVSENEQFGGITPGVHVSSHKYAIDVNQGSGITEANIPDLRKKFDELALRYQARGYRVLWNGKVYEPGGHGASGAIKGADKHFDHLHVEAPSSIVGKATQSSTEEQAVSEYRKQAQVEEQQKDFVGGVVDTANARGHNENRGTALQAQIKKELDEFNRRFNHEASATQRGAITKALTDADAREIAKSFDDAYVAPLERLKELQGTTGLSRDILNKQLAETDRLGRELNPIEKQQIEDSVRQGDALQRSAAILEAIHKPLEDYKASLAELNKLLSQGKINQTDFNAQVSDLGANARGIVASLPGVDKKSGKSFSSIGGESEEDSRYAKELQALQQNRQQLLQMGLDYDALEEAAKQQHVDNLNKIDDQRKLVALEGAQGIADSLLQITADSVGKQNAVYKALFIATKAFAIAEAIINIQRGISQAAALPFPANIPAIASVIAATASIVSNIQQVALNLADGGLVTGPGGSRSDSIHANLSNGEFVVNAQSTRQNRSLLEAINSGGSVRAARERSSNDNGSGRPVNVTINGSDAPGVEWDVKQISENDVEIIARRVVTKHAGKTVANEMQNPNSPISKTIGALTTSRRKRA